MKRFTLHRRCPLVCPLTAALLLALTSNSSALDLDAKTCSYEDVGGAVSQVESAGGGTVYIHEGTCTWNATLNVSGPVSFVGDGVSKTILTLGAGRVEGWRGTP